MASLHLNATNKQVMQSIAGGNVGQKTAIVMAGISKIFVGEIVETGTTTHTHTHTHKVRTDRESRALGERECVYGWLAINLGIDVTVSL